MDNAADAATMSSPGKTKRVMLAAIKVGLFFFFHKKNNRRFTVCHMYAFDTNAKPADRWPNRDYLETDPKFYPKMGSQIIIFKTCFVARGGARNRANTHQMASADDPAYLLPQ